MGTGSISKREAIIRGARTVFGRDGFSRASMDDIAATANVSSRTIYNHFGDKSGLFSALIVESAQEVRDAQTAEIERHIGKIVDLEEDLRALGTAFATTQARFPEHFALVRHIYAEAGHLPAEVLADWAAAGPRAVHRALTGALEDLQKRGLLKFDDSTRAANQFVALVGTEVNERTFGGTVPTDPAFIAAVVRAGVETFLRAFKA
ncbi:TetR/AcrR family transcriptional regulator [Roseibium sp.]|uniref:TetR/AcrR family transcriptional regulator n=1 Tax=Roseibium sp. TaxID=1936156 RepID=UPI003299DC1F